VIAARVALVAVVTILVQVTLLSPIEIAGGRPNVVVLFAIVAALQTNAERGAVAGFGAGLAFDLLLDTPAGLTALTLALVGWGVGAAKDVVLRSSWMITLALVVLASAAATLLYAAAAVVFGVAVDPAALPAIVAVIAVANALLSKPMRWALRWAFGPEPRVRSRDQLIFR